MISKHDLRHALLPLLALLLASCADRPEGNLIEVRASAPGASTVDMLVATTRAPVAAPPGVLFGGDRAIGLRFADITVSIPPDSARKVGEVQWPSSPPGDPAKDFVTVSAKPMELAQTRADFDRRVVGDARPFRADLRARLQHPIRGSGLPLRPDRA